jgi:FlaA1/EpsC-like NDP-sugar epimerase
MNNKGTKMEHNKVLAILGRNEFQNLINLKNDSRLKDKKILVVGANGSIGAQLCKTLAKENLNFLSTDIEGKHDYLDITSFQDVFRTINNYKPDYVVNIAAQKYATESESKPWKTLEVNTIGTQNLVNACGKDTKVILLSTCKACNPEIVYGASKSIAERIVLNSGGSVSRFFNVIQSQGNVFEIWDKIKETEPIYIVEECNRYFISLDEAIGLILYSILEGPGRFIVNTKLLRNMKSVVDAIYPNREKIIMPRRRGDRKTEIFLSTSETETKEMLFGEVLKVSSNHDKK